METICKRLLRIQSVLILSIFALCNVMNFNGRTDMTNRQWNLDDIDRVEDLSYAPLEKSYLKAQAVMTALSWFGLMFLPICLFFVDEFVGRRLIVICAEAAMFTAALVNLMLLPKAYSYKGYAVREHDITYRSGIIFPKTVTVPFCKVQQVSIRQNPVTKMFGLYAVTIVNGAQILAETVIPGLTREKAEEIKSLLIEMGSNESK